MLTRRIRNKKSHVKDVEEEEGEKEEAEEGTLEAVITGRVFGGKCAKKNGRTMEHKTPKKPEHKKKQHTIKEDGGRK